MMTATADLPSSTAALLWQPLSLNNSSSGGGRRESGSGGAGGGGGGNGTAHISPTFLIIDQTL